MKSILGLLVIGMVTVCSPATAAADTNRCDSPQNVSLSWDGTHLSDWTVDDGEVKSFELLTCPPISGPV